MADTPHILWQIDDHGQWLRLSEATVARVAGWSFQGFLSAESAFGSGISAGVPRVLTAPFSPRYSDPPT